MRVGTVPFYNHVDKTLNPYKWGVALVASIMMAGFFSFVVVKGQIDSSKKILGVLSPYVATLAQSSDRPEILRVLANAVTPNGEKIIFVKDGHVFASSASAEELDMPFQRPSIDFRVFDISISQGQIVSSSKSGLYIFSALAPTIWSAIWFFIGTFTVCIAVAVISSIQTKRAIRKALKPLDQLHREIEQLPSFDSTPSEPIKVQELESIRQRLLSAKVDLENAKDKLAEEKAQKMSAKAFKQLIHDLHNPVAALRTMVKVAVDSETTQETKEEAFEYLPQIADQILGQVTAAKKNLEEEPVALRETNVLSTVAASVKQVAVLSSTKKIITQNDCDEAMVAHDPDLLKRALVNLLENAVTAANAIVRVSVHQDTKGTSIHVCDDGHGMDETKIPLFFQGRGMSGKANRQAFGLSSTNHIVRSHGGKLIYRKSDLGGSSFEIRLGAI